MGAFNYLDFKSGRKVLYFVPYSMPEEFFATIVDQQAVVACPNPPVSAVKNQLAVSTPTGVFDSRKVIEALPLSFKPDLITISSRDPSFVPLNLNHNGVPTLMKLGDTYQSSDGSIYEMIKHCLKVDCDFHLTYQGVQHLHFFAEAGLKNPFWVPSSVATLLTDQESKLNPKRKKNYRLIFRGNILPVHVYRKHIIEEVLKNGFPLNVGQANYSQCLVDYSQAQITLNCSGNGDFNRRIFECLAAGGFLLTDRLSSQAGLSAVLTEGVHYEAYGSVGELIEKIRYYLDRPGECLKIATAGYNTYRNNLSREHFRDLIEEFIFNGKIDSKYRYSFDPRAPKTTKEIGELNSVLTKRVKVYELLQELHRINTQLRVVNLTDIAFIESDLSDLPRLKTSKHLAEGADVVLVSEESQVSLKELKEHAYLLVYILGQHSQHKRLLSLLAEQLKEIKLAESLSGLQMGKGAFLVFYVKSSNDLRYFTFRPFRKIKNKVKTRYKQFKQRVLDVLEKC